MDLPKNGSVVIIDDKIEEAFPLMNALAKRGVPYSYYDGKSKNYPEKTLDNVRIIFLDMHLDEAAGGATNTKNIVSLLVAGIDALVNENNGPYVVMVWSKHDSQHLIELEDTLLNKNSVSCRPIAVLNMEKSLCFESIYDENNVKSEWKLRCDGMDILEKNLSVQLKMIDSFLILCNWENGIKNSARETVEAIGTLFDRKDQKWNDNLKACMIRMAKAYAGQNLDMSDENLIKNVYFSMNNILSDFNGVETEQIVKKVAGEIQFPKGKKDIAGRILVLIEDSGKEYTLSCDDKMYYIYEDAKPICQNKDMIKLFKDKADDYNRIRGLLYDTYLSNVCSINSLLNIRKNLIDKTRPGNIYEASEKLKKELCDVRDIDKNLREDIKGIELEISPICDYAQNKRKRLRILPGLEIPAKLLNKEDSKYTYLTIPIMIDGKERRMLFDFRFYTSELIDYFDEKNPLYAIGDELLQNIKEELSTHSIRSGIVYVK